VVDKTNKNVKKSLETWKTIAKKWLNDKTCKNS
jgi:hypothetical protein